jgi:hypothetical protein
MTRSGGDETDRSKEVPSGAHTVHDIRIFHAPLTSAPTGNGLEPERTEEIANGLSRAIVLMVGCWNSAAVQVCWHRPTDVGRQRTRRAAVFVVSCFARRLGPPGLGIRWRGPMKIILATVESDLDDRSIP